MGQIPTGPVGEQNASALAAVALALLGACDPGVRSTTLVEPVTGRRYALVVRADRDPGVPAPALFVLHPYATEPAVLPDNYALERRAVAKRGWILVVPEGTRDAGGRLSWNASAACCGTGEMRPDDLDYLRLVLADVRRRGAIDEARVYAFGESNGGFMAHRWACDPQGGIRALVSIAGAAPGPDDPPCGARAPVSVLQVHGDRDAMVRYEGGRTERGRYPSARESVALWRRLDACEPVPRTSVETRLFFLSPLRVEAWSCPHARVALWTAAGGGHQLPAIRRWTEEMLDFLARSD